MPEVFTSDEILQIAMELEQTGQVFYEALAVGCRNERVGALCRRLAGQEQAHYHTFRRMREKLTSQSDGQPMDLQDLEFVQGLINDRVVPSPQAARELAAQPSLTDALELAIKLENDTVAFYTQLVPAVGKEHAPVIRAVIAEEQTHVRDLTAAQRDLH